MKRSYIETENNCKIAFLNAGPVWFASSPGKDTPLLFSSKDDFAFAMNVIAQEAFKFAGLKIIAFVVMNNHFHFVMACNEPDLIRMFFEAVKKRLKRYCPDIRSIGLDIREVADLNSLRNHIVYTHRNGYVADSSHTPFSYPWGTGRYFFNNIPVLHNLSDYKVSNRRKMFRGRDPELPDCWNVLDGYVVPASYCDIRNWMSFFRDAHHYMSLLTKDIETYSDISSEMDDGEFLTDSELFSRAVKIVKEEYGVGAIRELSRAQRLDMARKLHYEYRSSNGQIRRVLGLTQYDVNSLFPLTRRD